MASTFPAFFFELFGFFPERRPLVSASFRRGKNYKNYKDPYRVFDNRPIVTDRRLSSCSKSNFEIEPGFDRSRNSDEKFALAVSSGRRRESRIAPAGFPAAQAN
jgi:hypothetical protein